MSSSQTNRWVVLLGLSLTYAVTNGILVHTLPLIYPQLIDSFGWTQSQVTLPATVFLIVNALTSLPAGALLDRLSPVKIIAAGLLAIVIGLLVYSRVESLWQLVAVYVVMAVGLAACGLVSNMLVLSRWFEQQRGRATGILLMSSSAGGVIFPLVLGGLIAAGNWRTAMQLLAIIAVVVALIPMLLLVRDRPDAAVTLPGDTPARKQPPEGPTVAQALRQPRFYLVALSTGAVWFALIGMQQHQSIYLAKDIGVEFGVLPVVFSSFFASAVVGKLLFGWLSDHFSKILMMVLSIATLAVAMIVLRNVGSAGNVSLFGYAILGGIGFGGAFTMIQLMFANFYAGDSFGKILALLMLVDTLSGALGTRVLAVMREASGHYLGGIDLIIGLLLFAAASILIAGRGYRDSLPNS